MAQAPRDATLRPARKRVRLFALLIFARSISGPRATTPAVRPSCNSRGRAATTVENRHAVRRRGAYTACRRSSCQCAGDQLADTGRLFHEHQYIAYAASA